MKHGEIVSAPILLCLLYAVPMLLAQQFLLLLQTKRNKPNKCHSFWDWSGECAPLCHRHGECVVRCLKAQDSSASYIFAPILLALHCSLTYFSSRYLLNNWAVMNGNKNRANIRWQRIKKADQCNSLRPLTGAPFDPPLFSLDTTFNSTVILKGPEEKDWVFSGKKNICK